MEILDLKPDWVVGFVDGEGCFYVGVSRNRTMKTGYQVLPEFRIVQHKRDIQVLYALRKFFGCGVVRKNHDDRYELRIRKRSCLKKVVEFFEKHPLKTKKNVDFKKFRRILIMMERGEHLTKEGLIKILEIAMEMNTGNHERLKRTLEEIRGLDEDTVHPHSERVG
ncbi:homing endonuclease, laglidadg/hnh [Thermotoga neapolitana DSM 4359]